MTLEQFKLLKPSRQTDIIFAFAEKVEERIEGPYKYILYNLYDFYVEKQFSLKYDMLLEIIVFDSLSRILDAYTSDIDLSEIKG